MTDGACNDDDRVTALRAVANRRAGAMSERWAVVTLLADFARHITDTAAATEADRDSALWSRARLAGVNQAMKLVMARETSYPPEPPMIPPGGCAECGRAKAGGAWERCTTCGAGSRLICPGCTFLHDAVHAARGDSPPRGSISEGSEHK